MNEYKKIAKIKAGIKINICIPFIKETIVRKTAMSINKNQDLDSTPLYVKKFLISCSFTRNV
jgi:hypothetical protein